MNKLFVYQGHTFRANIEGDATLVVESLKATPIKHGVYPVNFAEGEVWQILADEMEDVKEENLQKADARLQIKISDLILDGKFSGIDKL